MAGNDDHLSQISLNRIKKDLFEFYSERLEGLFLAPDEEKANQLHALLVGPAKTPYEGGFFYFVLNYPGNYPVVPPIVKYRTTGNGKVRINPNLYSSGKVCLSLLGTWTGPSWSPALTTTSLLLSIQSLLAEEPYHNEPGFEKKQHQDEGQKQQVQDSKAYNEFVKHESLRVAVLDMVQEKSFDGRDMPEVLNQLMRELFVRNVDKYLAQVEESLEFHGRDYNDPFGGSKGTFDYKGLKKRFEEAKAAVGRNREETFADGLYDSLVQRFGPQTDNLQR